jgi:16S rRNA (cytidine1402-2'-O)-methyltransferase
LNFGTLYLLPVPLGETPAAAVSPGPTLETTCRLRHFVVENAKTARAMLKLMGHPVPLRELDLQELNEHTPAQSVAALLEPLRQGNDLGLMSEAGCPAVADPGSLLVAQAHAEGIRVVPLVGPSSLLLALMASGLNGQNFAFHGYLPAREPERSQALRNLESTSRKTGGVQLFIETPYRNGALFDSVLAACQPGSRLCVAVALTTAEESVRTRTVSEWRRHARPPFDKQPAVFLLQA